MISIIAFLKNNKNFLLIIGIILLIIFYEFRLSNYKADLLEITNKNIILKNENKNLADGLILMNKELELKLSVINGLNSKLLIINDSMENTINIWKEKYEFCLSNELGNQKIENLEDNKTENKKQEVLNEKSSDFYIDLYNNKFFK